MKDNLMTQEQMEASYNRHVKEGTKRTFGEWIQKWAPNEVRIRVTITDGKDGPDCCITYGTMKEHSQHFIHWLGGMGDQGYRWDDISTMYPAALEDITYEHLAKDFDPI
jgi:hypothetical protein